LANSNALKFANISRNTKDVAGGLIVRDESGNPTGILKDNAVNLLQPFIPKPSLQDMVKNYKFLS
jgi:predicted amidohydrolase YtcJ